MSSELKITNSSELALKLVSFTFIAVVLAFVIFKLKLLIVCILLSLTLASAMAPIAEFAEKHKVSRLIAVLFLYVVGGLVYAACAMLLAPLFIEQWLKLSGHLPGYLAELSVWHQKALNLSAGNTDASLFDFADLSNLSLRFVRQTLDMTSGLLGLIVNTILVLFLAAYFVVEAKSIWTAIFKWLPGRWALRLQPLIVPVASRMGGYVRGQILVAMAVALFLILCFSLIKVKYALVLGVLAGLLNLVPFVGSFIACAVAAVVAFNQTPVMALAVLLIYAIEQWVESSFMVPHLVGKQASLHPLIVLLSIITGATLMGTLGALISVPIAAVSVYLAEEFYLKSLVESESLAGSSSAGDI